MKEIKVGIQGVQGSFHDIVRVQYFKGKNTIPVPSPSFKDLFENLKSKKTDLAIMAIENTIAGSILPNYNLLESYQFKVMGEAYLRIELNLMAIPGQKIIDLNSALTHPMALYQCEEFLNKNKNLKLMETSDTAESAQMISEKKLMGAAAIASSLAAKIYNLEILAPGIETNKQNYTRFLVISRDSDLEVGDKASLRFQVKHEPGSLVKVLEIFDKHKINMTKLQSVPVLGRPYEYAFHVDLEFDDIKPYRAALHEVEESVSTLAHFGLYKKSERPVA